MRRRDVLARIRRFLNNGDVNRFRTVFQIAAFALLIYGGLLAIDLGNTVPAFSCVFADTRAGACYLFPLQHQVNLTWKQYLGGRGIALLSGIVTFFLFFALFNKAWCGFACPLGAIQDWITKLRVKIGLQYASYREGTFGMLKSIKYVLLALLLLLPMGIANSLFGLPKLPHELGTAYCMICPGRTILPLFTGDTGVLAVDFSSRTMTVLTGLGMAITGVFLVGAFVKKRFFCLFCPMSALQYVFSKAALLRLRKNGSKCTRCGNCFRVCDVGIREIADDVTSTNIVKDDCMMCFKCVAACPEDKCLTVSFLGMPLYEATQEGFARRGEGRDRRG